jgi:hypothetical protein
MACIECNKTITDNISYSESNRINFSSPSERIRMQGVAGGGALFVPSDNNRRYTDEDNFEGLGLPAVCYTQYSNNSLNMNQYYSEESGLYRFNFPYMSLTSGSSRQSSMLRNASRPENASYFYGRNLIVNIKHIGWGQGAFFHGYPNCAFNPESYLARFPNIIYTDENYRLRTDAVSDNLTNTLRVPPLDGGLLVAFFNSNLTKSWWLYLEHGHRRCNWYDCTPRFVGVPTNPNNYNEEDAFCGFYGYLFELTREEMDASFDAFVTYNVQIGSMTYAGLKLNVSMLPDSRFTKFRAWYKIKKRTTCVYTDSFLPFEGPFNLSCGSIILELSDLLTFNFNSATNHVEFNYGNRFSHTYNTLHDNQYISPFITGGYNTRPILISCNLSLPEGTRPLVLFNNSTNIRGQFDMVSSYPYIYGENPFLSFPRLTIT